MKNSILIFTFALSLLQIAPAEEPEIVAIQKEFAKWESESHTTEKYIREWDGGGGELELTLHRKKSGEVRGVTLGNYGEHGWSTETYYFKSGTIFFALLTQGDEPLRGPSKVREMRLYFNNGEIIRALKKSFQGEGDKALKKSQQASQNQKISVSEALANSLMLKGHALAGLERNRLNQLEEIALAGNWYFEY